MNHSKFNGFVCEIKYINVLTRIARFKANGIHSQVVCAHNVKLTKLTSLCSVVFDYSGFNVHMDYITAYFHQIYVELMLHRYSVMFYMI